MGFTNNLIAELKSRKFPVLQWYLMFIALLIPIYKKAVPLVIAAAAIHTLINSIKKRFREIGNVSTSHYASAAFYLLFVVGMLYSENIAPGLFDLQVKLSFLIFPLIFFLQSKEQYQQTNRELILKAFVAGCLLASTIALAHSIFVSFQTQFNADHFIYTELSYKLHPSYFSMYLNLAVFIVGEWMIKSWKTSSLFTKAMFFLLQLFFMVFILFLNSKAGILILFITLFPYLVFQIIRFRKYLLGLVAIILTITLIAVIWIKIPAMSTRISFFIEKMMTYDRSNADAYDSTTERLLIWRNSIQVVEKNLPWGAGTGDGKKELVDNYNLTGFKYGAERGFNSHNQYLQTLISLGIPGLILLLLVFATLMVHSTREKSIPAFLFTMIVLLHLLVESMFETQAGTVFIAFFISVFALRYKKNCPKD